MRRFTSRGYVTAETAMVLPVLVLVTVAAVWAVVVATMQLRCVDAAHVGARAAARGESDERVVALARADAPGGAEITVERTAAFVTVHVRVSARPGGALSGRIPAIGVAASATARVEGDGPIPGGVARDAAPTAGAVVAGPAVGGPPPRPAEGGG